MPTLRLYPDLYFTSSWEEIEDRIRKEEKNFAAFNKNDNIIRSGIYKNSSIVQKIEDSNYHILNYLLKQSRKIPSKQTELSYFKLIPGRFKEEKEAFFYPTLIKIIMNKQKRVLGFYTRRNVKELDINQIIRKMDQIYGFNFKYQLADNHIKFEKNRLDQFLLSLGEVKNFTSISILDQDNTIIAENDQTLSETKKIIEFLREVSKGNWEYVQLVSNDLNFEIRLTNNRTMNYITFLNNYVDDAHLATWVDFFFQKVKRTIPIAKMKQVKMRNFY